MTDLQDQLLLRRVLLPTEYLQSTQRGFADTGLRAGTELPLRVVRDGRETWLRVKSIDRAAALKKPQMQ